MILCHCFGKAWIIRNNLNFSLFVKEASSFTNSQVLSFLSLSKTWPGKFKPLSDKLGKKTCVLAICIFLLNQMNCEHIAEGKLGEEDKDFPHLFSNSLRSNENNLIYFC